MNQRNVIIIGGGPVGCALALDLGLRGVSSVVLESRKTLGNIPKGQGLTQRTLEHFHFWGLTEELRAARLMPRGYPIGEITAYRNLASDYWHAPAGREVVNDFFFQKNERLPQYRMEAVLRRRLEALPNADVRLGVTATKIEQSSDKVCATFVDENGTSATFEADYLIGCDGSHSMVRESAGIARSGTNFDQNMVLIVFRSRDLHEKLKRFPERSTYRVLDPDLHGYWKFFGRVDVGEEFFFHVPIPNDIDRKNFNFNECLFNATGFEFSFEILHAGFWDLRNAVASTYREGRIFIAGDAAHSHPPYGGYGLNNGLEDAVNLSWKMAASFAGWGSDRLLDSYSAEREPIFREVAEDFIAARIRQDDAFLTRYNPTRDRAEFEAAWKARETDVGSRRKAYEPHYDGSSVICGAPDGKTEARGVHSLQARAGHHLSPQVLSSGRNVYEELGRDFTLIALAADTEADAFEQAAQSRKVPLKIIRDTATAARENYGSPLILVRPDQHVAWVGETAEDASGIIQKAAGQ